jgi:hypothetical protein
MSTDDPLGRFFTTLRVLAIDGPFRIGAPYSFASPHDDVQFDGVIVNVARVEGEWVEITVEHSGEVQSGGD